MVDVNTEDRDRADKSDPVAEKVGPDVNLSLERLGNNFKVLVKAHNILADKHAGLASSHNTTSLLARIGIAGAIVASIPGWRTIFHNVASAWEDGVRGPSLLLAPIEGMSGPSSPLLVYKENGTSKIVDLPLSRYDHYRNRYPDLRDQQEFAQFLTPEDPVIVELARALTLGANNKSEEAARLLNFVRDVSYDKNELNSGQERVRFPVETLMERTGDCEDVSILYCSLLMARGIDCALLQYEDHMAVGISGDFSGTHFEIGEKKFFFVECGSPKKGPGDTTLSSTLGIGDAWDKYKTEAPNRIIMLPKPL